MSARLLPASAAALLALAAVPSAHALTLYDDFTSTVISPTKWTAQERTQYGATVTESRRISTAGQLRLEVRGYSDKTSNTGTGRVRNSLVAESSSTITTMKATITPRFASFGTCGSNSTASNIRYRLIGFFFNPGASLAAGQFGDVGASFQVYRLNTDPVDTYRVSGAVFQCTDSDCNSNTTLGTTGDIGATLATGSSAELTLVWDKTNHRFTFTRDALAAVNVAYTLNETKTASQPAKRIEVTNDVANCTTARMSAYGGADFDNIYVNP